MELYNHRWLEARNLGFRKKRKCTVHVAKTKMLISFSVTAKLMCAFVSHKWNVSFLMTRLV